MTINIYKERKIAGKTGAVWENQHPDDEAELIFSVLFLGREKKLRGNYKWQVYGAALLIARQHVEPERNNNIGRVSGTPSVHVSSGLAWKQQPLLSHRQ